MNSGNVKPDIMVTFECYGNSINVKSSPRYYGEDPQQRPEEKNGKSHKE